MSITSIYSDGDVEHHSSELMQQVTLQYSVKSQQGEATYQNVRTFCQNSRKVQKYKKIDKYQEY